MNYYFIIDCIISIVFKTFQVQSIKFLQITFSGIETCVQYMDNIFILIAILFILLFIYGYREFDECKTHKPPPA